jgi:hypothetical protein
MSYTPADLEALQQALATGERRVSFGDKTVEYRSVAELQAAIRTVAAARLHRVPPKPALPPSAPCCEVFSWERCGTSGCCAAEPRAIPS